MACPQPEYKSCYIAQSHEYHSSEKEHSFSIERDKTEEGQYTGSEIFNQEKKIKQFTIYENVKLKISTISIEMWLCAFIWVFVLISVIF